MQVLSLHGCTKVSDEAVAAVALHGSLTSLNVNSIPGIGLSTIKALATATRYAPLGSTLHYMHMSGFMSWGRSGQPLRRAFGEDLAPQQPGNRLVCCPTVHSCINFSVQVLLLAL